METIFSNGLTGKVVKHIDELLFHKLQRNAQLLLKESKQMTKFTKGPWLIEYGNADSKEDGEWYCVGPATIHFPYSSKKEIEEEAKANAQLCAAAPELYEALEELMVLFKSVLDDPSRVEGFKVYQDAQAAIKKAEGK